MSKTASKAKKRPAALKTETPTSVSLTAAEPAKPQPPVESGKPKRQIVRAQIFGHAATAVIRWMGANGWTFDEARAALAEFGAAGISDTTVRIQLPAGKKGERGPAAPISEDQAKQLRAAVKTNQVEA